MRKSVKILIIVLVVTVLGIGGYFGYKVLIQREGKKQKLGAEYLDKNLTRPEARKAILEYQEGTGDRTPPFEVIASKRLSKKQMSKLDRGIVEKALPGYEKAWFVQIEMENGGHFGYFLIQDKDLSIVCYRKLTRGDPMYGIVVQDQKIYRKP